MIELSLSFLKPETCGQTVLPDRSVLIGQKLVENAKIQICDILSDFQTMCIFSTLEYFPLQTCNSKQKLNLVQIQRICSTTYYLETYSTPQIYDLLYKASTDAQKYYYGKRMIESTTTTTERITSFFSGNGTFGKIGTTLQALKELGSLFAGVSMIGTMTMGIYLHTVRNLIFCPKIQL